MTLQNVSDRLIGDLMAEVGESAGDAIVTPAFVLLGHAEDQRFEFMADARTSRVGAMLRAVELAGDQAAVPREDGLRSRNTGHLCETLPPQPLAISARVERSASETRRRPETWERRIRFYAIRYSHWRSRR